MVKFWEGGGEGEDVIDSLDKLKPHICPSILVSKYQGGMAILSRLLTHSAFQKTSGGEREDSELG